MMEVTYSPYPEVVIGSHTFRNVPTILQFEGTPLLEVRKYVGAGFEAHFSVFNNDGKKIAVVKGSSIHRTAEGAAASLTLRQEAELTVCELEGKPILELRRTIAQALKGSAQLYAPEGILIKANDSEISALLQSGQEIFPGVGALRNSSFDGCEIGIWYSRTSIALGVGGGTVHIGSLRT